PGRADQVRTVRLSPCHSQLLGMSVGACKWARSCGGAGAISFRAADTTSEGGSMKRLLIGTVLVTALVLPALATALTRDLAGNVDPAGNIAFTYKKQPGSPGKV